MLTATWWVEPGRSPRPGHDAIAASPRTATVPWNVVGRALGLPGLRTIGRAVYPVIAPTRHRLPGATEACALDLPSDA